MNLPSVFDPLNAVNVRFRHSHWTAANCPKCGQRSAKNGDRLVLRLKGLGGTSFTHAWCRKCDKFVWVPGQETRNAGLPADWVEPGPAPKVIARKRWQVKRNQTMYVKNEKIRFHWWAMRGVPNDLVRRYNLGHCYAKRFRDGAFDTITMPIYDKNGDILHIQHRLLADDVDHGRYRWDVAGLPMELLWLDSDKPAKNLYLTEGIIKALIMRTVADPSVSVAAHMMSHLAPETAAQLTGHHIVYFPDPDIRGEKLESKVGLLRAAGNTVTVIGTPDNWKIDDLILAHPEWRIMCTALEL